MSMNDTYSDLSLNAEEPVRVTAPKHASQVTIENETGIRLYWRRWFILAIFSLFIILNVFNLTEYFDVEDTFIQFYVCLL